MTVPSVFVRVLDEARKGKYEGDPTQGVVAVRAAGIVYVGHVVSVDAAEGVVELVRVDRGRSSDYPVYLALDEVTAVRAADLIDLWLVAKQDASAPTEGARVSEDGPRT